MWRSNLIFVFWNTSHFAPAPHWLIEKLPAHTDELRVLSNGMHFSRKVSLLLTAIQLVSNGKQIQGGSFAASGWPVIGTNGNIGRVTLMVRVVIARLVKKQLRPLVLSPLFLQAVAPAFHQGALYEVWRIMRSSPYSRQGSSVTRGS